MRDYALGCGVEAGLSGTAIYRVLMVAIGYQANPLDPEE